MASMLEKLNVCKKALDLKVEAIEKESQMKIDIAGEEFLEDFKSLVESASDDEFVKFLELPRGVVDDVDKIAAVIMRTTKS